MRLSTIVLVLAAQLVTAVPNQKRQSFNFNGEKVQGVNIGGWLVLEPWITPSIFQAQPGFEIIDEYTLGQHLGHDAAYNVLKPHWDNWITEVDFQNVKKFGLNVVRIPIGFWAYDTFGAPYVMGAADYLDKAIGWCRTAGLKVLIDLHGAPLSQNGFDNSGQKLAHPGWQGGDSVNQTLQVLQTISKKYAGQDYADVVMGIELLNEPLGPQLNVPQIQDFYRAGYQGVRDVGSTTVVLHDAFIGTAAWDGFLMPSDSGAYYVALDHHEYQVFDNGLVGMSPAAHRAQVCNGAGAWDNSDHWNFVGEWTAAMTDCAAALNGYGIGARYDGTYPGSTYHGSCATINWIDTWTPAMIDDHRAYVEAQLNEFESKTNGWIFWTLKTEASAEWDMYRLINVGAFPQPLSDRRFPPGCA